MWNPNRTRTLGALGGLAAIIVLMAALVAASAVPALIGLDRAVAGVGGHLDDVPPLPADLGAPAQRSAVVAADGSLLATLFEENREVVPLERVPEHVRQAVLAIEDARFFEHDGVDLQGALRALATNLRSGRAAEGGSTITQQYVKNLLLSPDTTVERKLVEAVYAVEIERRRSKEEILEGYLNIAYFGQGAYGIAAAAQFYFGREVEELTLAQGAVLAGLLANPTNLEPIENPERSRARRDVVLARMVDVGFLEEGGAAEARDEPIDASPHPLPEHLEPFFVEYVKQVLLDDPRLGETREERIDRLFRGGLTIETTIDLHAQESAEAALAAHLSDPVDDPLGSVVSIEPETGAIRAMALGPREFGACADEEEPCAEMRHNPTVPGMGGSGRQPGSAFKPVLLAAALEQGVGTDWHARTEAGEPIEGCGPADDPWTPGNYSDGASGTMDMVDAIRVSNNVYHAELIAEVGPQAVVEMADRLGFGRRMPPVCAISLGSVEVFPMEMASAFGVLANGGVRCTPIAVTRIVAPDGSVVVEDEPACERVVSEETAATMTSLLRNVITSGTGTGAAIGRDAAGKTGTTNDHRDAWFVGYVPQLSTAVWVGYEVPREMRGILGLAQVSGGSVPASIWGAAMSGALEGVEVVAMPTVQLDRYTPPRRVRPSSGPSRSAPEHEDADGSDETVTEEPDEAPRERVRDPVRGDGEGDGSDGDDRDDPPPGQDEGGGDEGGGDEGGGDEGGGDEGGGDEGGGSSDDDPPDDG